MGKMQKSFMRILGGSGAGLLLVASLGVGTASAVSDGGTVSCGANHAGVWGVQNVASNLMTTKVRTVVVYSGTGKTSDLSASHLVGTQPWSASSASLNKPSTTGACLP